MSQEKVYRLCGFSQQGEFVSAPTIVRGKVGFLEMGDALFETPELMVNFDNPELGSCSAVGSLIEAMNSGNAETIAERTCSLAGVSREIVDNQLQSILRLMTKLSENNNSTTRKCAIDSALAIYRRLSSRQTRPNQDPLLGSQVDRSLPTQKSGSDFDIAISLLRIINTSIFAEKEAIQKQYDHSFTELVSILWSAQNHLKLSATEKQKLLKQTLNIIEKILQNKKTDTHRYFVVRDVLNHLGPVARPYISDLLKYLIEPSMQRYGLISSLVRVAPNDPRVFDAAVNYFKTSHEWDAADILIAAGKEKTSVVLDLLLSALREGDDEKSRVIKAVGSMGNEAMSAKPLLYLVARTTKHPRTREFALLAVVDIDKQDPTIAQEIIQELEHPLTDSSEQTFAGNIEMRSCNYIYALGKLGKNAQIALPALKKIMQEKLTRTQRYALESAFRNMQLEETELRSLLATLNNTQLVY